MPRPRKSCTIQSTVPARFYKPRGVPMRALKALNLSVEGLEALRLADAEGLEHVAAAEMMGVSRPTFSRLLAEARTTVATALVQGWALDVDGLDVAVEELSQNTGPCCKTQGMRRRRGHSHRWHHAQDVMDSNAKDMEEENNAE